MEYPDIDKLPEELKEAVLSRGGANVYHMLMHSRGMAMGFCAFGDAIFEGCSLPHDLREMVIMRVGHVYKSPYEIHQHETLSRLLGISEDIIAACQLDGDQSILNETQVAILSWTDAVLEHHALPEPARSDALKVLGAEQLADFILVVGFYQLVCNFLNTFDVEIDTGNVFEKARDYRQKKAAQ